MIVAVGSDAMEFGGWLRHCTGVRKLPWPVDFARQADWNGQAVTMVANGAGPRLAAAALEVAKERETVTAVMSIGWCGALDPALGLSEIFVALGVRTAAGDRAALAPRKMPAGTRRGTPRQRPSSGTSLPWQGSSRSPMAAGRFAAKTCSASTRRSWT